MPELVARSSSTLEGTFKGRDVEGIVDLYFYRRIAFRLAQFFARLHWTPAAVTALGGVVGIIAGHLYFYRDLTTNLVGMALHVIANTLDNADGQLARLLNKKSRFGRVIDSFFDHLIFVSIYVHLGLRCLFHGGGPMVVLLVIAAGVSHALQGAAADYFRNAYLYFVNGRSRADWDSTRGLRVDYRSLSWQTAPWQKFLLAMYLNFTWQQEVLSPKLRRLRQTAEENSDRITTSFRQQFREVARPMLRGWSLLMTNTRMLLLLICLVIDHPALYFWFELTIFNGLLAWLLLRQESIAIVFGRELAEARLTQ